MAFDAGMLACVVHEIKCVAEGGRIEKIYQPEKDEIILQMRTTQGGKRLLINAGSNCPRISFTSAQRENPMQAPMFCMLLRKHLTGASLSSVEQIGFERVARLCFDTRDEMGYDCKKYLIAEIMGKYSNLIFTDENFKIISSLKTIDFTTSSLRQVLPGMRYELPPPQDKLDPTKTTQEEFLLAYSNATPEKSIEKFITGTYLGIASSIAREISYRACGRFDALLCNCPADKLYGLFESIYSALKVGSFSPSVILDGSSPIEYAFITLSYFGSYDVKCFDSASEVLDIYFAGRDKEQRIKQRAADVLRLLTNAESRLAKKIATQEGELADCEKGEKYKAYGDLITANIYKLKRGDRAVELVDYESWNEEKQDFDTAVIELDERLTPASNAQRYYKLYNKSKTAKVELSRQLDIARGELSYIYTVFDALTKAETTADLAEIRDELYKSGYASKMKGYAAPKKQHAPIIAEFVTTNGYKVLCGKNNYQNEYITHKIAERHDYWFHAKNIAGSHVLMITNGDEPPAEDFTDACEIAAYFSKAKGASAVEVDYLFARGVKKVSGAKPGFVIYHNNWSAIVTPTEERIHEMRKK